MLIARRLVIAWIVCGLALLVGAGATTAMAISPVASSAAHTYDGASTPASGELTSHFAKPRRIEQQLQGLAGRISLGPGPDHAYDAPRHDAHDAHDGDPNSVVSRFTRPPLPRTDVGDRAKPVSLSPDFLAAETGRADRVVIGKIADITGRDALGPGERTLLNQLPDQGGEAANWAQNERVLLKEMKAGNPIRDATVDPSTGELTNNTGFLALERGLLEREGWAYQPGSQQWIPRN